MFIGVFTLYYCTSFLGDFWNTFQRTISIVVTSTSALMFFRIGEWLPESLPNKIVALSFFLIMFIGLAILIWFAYNLLVAWQKEFRIRCPAIATLANEFARLIAVSKETQLFTDLDFVGFKFD